jgi:hypothetical protein
MTVRSTPRWFGRRESVQIEQGARQVKQIPRPEPELRRINPLPVAHKPTVRRTGDLPIELFDFILESSPLGIDGRNR